MARPLQRICPRKASGPSEPVDRRSAASRAAERLIAGRHLRIDPAERTNSDATQPAAGADVLTRVEIEQQLLLAATECLATVEARPGTAASGSEAPVKSGLKKSSTRQPHSRQTHSRRPASAERPVPNQGRRSAEDVQRMVQASETSGTARVQLRLSSAVVRILKGFSRAGRHPSAIVERALWEHAAIQDAATILGISRER